MNKNEIKLTEKIEKITIEVMSSDVTIYQDKVKIPIVKVIGDITITEKFNQVIIKENPSSVKKKNISFSNGNATIIIGGNVVFNGKEFGGEPSNVEIIIPKNTNIQDLEINTQSGDLKIKNIICNNLAAKTMSGDIILNDVDMLFINLKTMSGDIKGEILESIMNYKTSLNSMSGDIEQQSIEKNSPVLLEKKHELEASSMSGDIEILFKGKRRKR